MRKPWWMKRGSCFSCKNYATSGWNQPCFDCMIKDPGSGWEKDSWWKAIWWYTRLRILYRKRGNE